MTPAVQPLNLDWRLSQQDEQTLSVGGGVEKYLSNPIREAVKEKKEEERKIDEYLQKTIEASAGRYQDQILQAALKTRDKLKESGIGSWNSPESRKARSEAMLNLASLAANANAVSKLGQEGMSILDKKKYTYVDQAKARINEILAQDIDKIDRNELYDIIYGDAYTNWEAKAKDAVAEHIGPSVSTTVPEVISRNGVNIVGHWEWSNLFRPVIDPMTGRQVTDKITGRPAFENILGEPGKNPTPQNDDAVKAILLKMSGGEVDPQTNMPTSYRWLERAYSRFKPNEYAKIQSDEKTKQQTLFNYFRAIVGAQQELPKFVDDSVKGQTFNPFDLASWRNSLSVGSDPKKVDAGNREQAISSAYQSLLQNDVTTLNTIVQNSKAKNISEVKFASSYDDKVFVRRDNPGGNARTIDQIFKSELGTGMFDSKGNVVDNDAFNKKYKPFTGLYLKEKLESGLNSGKSFPVDDFTYGQPNPQLEDAVKGIVNYSWNFGNIPPGKKDEKPPAPKKKTIKASEIKKRAEAAGKTEENYRAALKENNVVILENQ